MSYETAPINRVVLTALDLSAEHRVLEVGFGHGKTLQKVAETITAGFVDGVDVSPTMLSMASRRCRVFLKTGQMHLALGDSANLPFPDQNFDRVYTVHTLYFWDDPVRHLREIHRVLQ
jgi:ubiquinone/menaquinone biosynthesis C-methylase UbiE